jgi:hypothetical protein
LVGDDDAGHQDVDLLLINVSLRSEMGVEEVIDDRPRGAGKKISSRTSVRSESLPSSVPGSEPSPETKRAPGPGRPALEPQRMR